MTIKKVPEGDTIDITWINSGITPAPITAKVYTGSETIVDSSAMVSSGNGHYYHLHTTSHGPGFYVADTLATIVGKPYRRRVKFQVVKGEVD
jgi:hypothetical protein